ncbi:MAG TPA: hypothetical protein DCE33_12360, partial [Rhodospirillaceae bacterium]|nr:hypothetical protein [Rhodospirillaceae bacterium]
SKGNSSHASPKAIKGQLFSRIAEGELTEEIRFPNDQGIAGHVFTTSQGLIVDDAYADERFNTAIDKKTGYKTESILCAPIRTPTGETIGVVQALNKLDGAFNQEDMDPLEAMTRRASLALLATQTQESAVPDFMRQAGDTINSLYRSILPAKAEVQAVEPAVEETPPDAPAGSETEQISAELAKEPAFQDCPTDTLARFLAHVTMRDVKRGEIIHDIDGQATDTYLIVDGAFKITSNGGKPITVESGFLGEEAGIGLDAYVSECRATKKSRVLAMPGHAMKALAASGSLRDRLIASFSGRFSGDAGARGYGERTVFSEVLESPRLAIGWVLALLVPVLVYYISLDMADFPGTQARYLLCAISVTVVMWIFSLLPEFVPALFVILVSILLGVVPPEVAVAGFGSKSFFMALSILGLSVVITVSGLSYRVLLVLLRIGPANKIWYNMCLFATGFALTPVVPTANGRISIVTPFMVDLLGAFDRTSAKEEAPRLTASVVTGISLMSAVFLSSKSVNFIVFGMLPTQEQAQFQFLNWMLAAAVVAAIMLILFALTSWIIFRNESNPSIPKTLVVAQSKMLGPMRPAEWAGVFGLGILLVSFLTAALHRIEVPWVAMAILFTLLMFGFIRDKQFREKIDWNFLIFLGALIGIVSSMQHTGLDVWLASQLEFLNEYMQHEFEWFVLMLTVAIFIVRLALPINAVVVIFAALLIPTAVNIGVNPWLVGFIILLMSESFIWPYQASYYIMFISIAGNKARSEDPRLVMMNFAIVGIKLLAVYASIPYWKALGLL